MQTLLREKREKQPLPGNGMNENLNPLAKLILKLGGVGCVIHSVILFWDFLLSFLVVQLSRD